MPPPDDAAREALRLAARDLLLLHRRCPELFERVIYLSVDDIRTLRELTLGIDDEDEPNGIE